LASRSFTSKPVSISIDSRLLEDARASAQLQRTQQDSARGRERASADALLELERDARRRYRRGLGIGLHIAKGIVEAHGGRMWAESELAAGSTFHFALPVESISRTQGLPPRPSPPTNDQ